MHYSYLLINLLALYIIYFNSMVKKINQNKVLLTGSTGFIGSYFLKNYRKKLNIKTFSFVSDSISDLNLNRIKTIVHCGALVHQMNKIPSYNEYFEINVKQTINLAKRAKQNNVKHFVFLSTAKVYGEESNSIFNENSRTNPLDDYARSKLEAENSLQKIEDENFKISILRLPLVYGPGVKANFSKLVNLVHLLPILPFGNITNKRSMVFIGNLNDVLFRIICMEKNGIFIVKDDESLSTTHLIRLIGKTINKRLYLFHFPFLNLLIKKIKPNYYKRLFMSLELDNSLTLNSLNINKNKFSNKIALKKTLIDYYVR